MWGRDCGQCFRPTWWDSTPCSLHVMCQPPGIRPAQKIGKDIERGGGQREGFGIEGLGLPLRSVLSLGVSP